MTELKMKPQHSKNFPIALFMETFDNAGQYSPRRRAGAGQGL
jgi:hypothetical protein